MGHNLIATIALGLGLAFVCGMLALRLKLPVILGYLAAGLMIGPFTPGFVADTDLARQLSEIGVSLLMFGVGLHFSIKDLWAVKKIAIPGALAQISAATVLGMLLAHWWGWSWGAGMVFGLSLSVASTVVLLRALGERGEIETVNGRIAVGWLVVEDIVTVVALVLLPALAGSLGGPESRNPADANLALSLTTTLGKVALFVAVMLVVGKRVIPIILGRVARTGNKELFTIGVLATAMGIAFGASVLFGVSPALGAFFAGVVLSESDLSHQAGIESRPVQDAFTVLFFVSVGMMFDPRVLIDSPVQVLTALSVVLIGKSIAAFGIVLLFRFPIATALLISASLAQIGEFSFILAFLGINLGLMPPESFSIVLAVAILSISLNPVIFKTIRPIERNIRKHSKLMRIFERRRDAAASAIGLNPKALRNHVVLVGYGRVGKTIAQALLYENIATLVIESDRTAMEEADSNGLNTLYGDASREEILTHASLDSARVLIVATPPRSEVREIVKIARKLNPQLVICARTHDSEEATILEELGIERIVHGEMELALEMAAFALVSYDRSPDAVEGRLAEMRGHGVINPEKVS